MRRFTISILLPETPCTKIGRILYHNDVLDPLVNKEDNLANKHANTFIPKLIGEARNYEIEANTRSKDIALFFWNRVIDHQTYCTGGNSHKENSSLPIAFQNI